MLRVVLLLLIAGFSYQAVAQGQASIGDAFSVERGGEELPLWEAGVGAGGVYRPDYPGADEYQTNGAPFPYVIYRGEFLRFGDGGPARFVAFENEHIELDLSFDGNLNVDSDESDARRGMPDLDFLAEVGPQLILQIGKYDNKKGSQGRLDVRLQARAAFSTDFSEVNSQGYVFEPELRYTHVGLYDSDIGFTLSVSPVFATEELHDYFYQVPDQFARAGRQAFDAQGGYLGTEIGFGTSIPLTDDLRLFAGGQVGYFGGSANEDSPLLRDEVNVTLGGALIWRLYESESKVTRRRNR